MWRYSSWWAKKCAKSSEKSTMHRCYEAERFRAITWRISLLLLFLKNIRNIKFCLRKKVIKRHYSNINHEITRLSSLTTRNLWNSSFTHCWQKSSMLCDNIWKRTCEKNSLENHNHQQNIQFCLFWNWMKV